MTAHVLTLNAGSSSLKFGLFAAGPEPVARAAGIVERIGDAPRLKAAAPDGAILAARDLAGADGHAGALAAVLDLLGGRFPDARITAVGHRVVHGGPAHAEPAAIGPDLVAELERLAPFAPLHQPHNLAGIRAALAAFPDALQVACFDTAFHRRRAFVEDAYGLPRAYYDKGVRRYGFHGLSYEFIAAELARTAPELHAGRVVVAHLGNGASMCAMLGGRSVASTMGFTPLDGLPMGTRCGQIDPGVLLYLMREEAMDAAAIADLLYRRSGLLGLSGRSNDMRRLEADGSPEARAAIDYFAFRARAELGALAATLGGLDALIFCGGIGENSPGVRARICDGMDWLGIALDPDRNAAGPGPVSTDASRVRVMVIPTDEEVVIARATLRLAGPDRAAAE